MNVADHGCPTGPHTAFLLAAILLCLSVAPALAANVYFVAPHGSTAGDGSADRPFGTIQQAADIVEPGDTVIIRDGVYTSNERSIVYLSRSGLPGEWITFKAENPWQAILDGKNFETVNGILLQNGVGWVRIEGLQIRETVDGGISADEDTHDVYYFRNLIHDIGRICTDTSGGLVGFRDKSSSVRMVYDSNVLHSVGRLATSATCNATLNNDGNHDHGLYLHGREIVIVNNVFYNFRRGWAIQSSQGAADWVIAQNTFAFANPDRQGQITLWEENTNFTIANNIFYEPNTAAIFIDPCRTKTNVTLENNISSGDLLYDDATGTNDCGRLTLLNNRTFTDPKLADPEQLDFHLTEASPAIDDAGPSVSPATDHDGIARPQGAGFDAGAFEFPAERERRPPRARATPRR